MRRHVDGTLVRKKPLSAISEDHNCQNNLKKLALVGTNGNNGKLQAYVYDLRFLLISTLTKDHFIKVDANHMRRHVDGTLVRKKPLSALSEDHNCQNNLKKLALVGTNGNNGKLQAYVYDLRLLLISTLTKDHFIKNPPMKLTLDDLYISDGIEEGNDGAWSIVGGKDRKLIFLIPHNFIQQKLQP